MYIGHRHVTDITFIVVNILPLPVCSFKLHKEPKISNNKCVDILEQVVTTGRYRYAFARANLLTTSPLQVVQKRGTQACCKSFQQVVTSVQMTSCNKPDLTDFLQLNETDKFVVTT